MSPPCRPLLLAALVLAGGVAHGRQYSSGPWDTYSSSIPVVNPELFRQADETGEHVLEIFHLPSGNPCAGCTKDAAEHEVHFRLLSLARREGRQLPHWESFVEGFPTPLEGAKVVGEGMLSRVPRLARLLPEGAGYVALYTWLHPVSGLTGNDDSEREGFFVVHDANGSPKSRRNLAEIVTPEELKELLRVRFSCGLYPWGEDLFDCSFVTLGGWIRHGRFILLLRRRSTDPWLNDAGAG